MLNMVDIDLLNMEGNAKDKFKLDQKVFDGKINYDLMHQAVVIYLANQRSYTASTKTRGEVKGSNKKPWRQKGTGRARAGSIRSPLWRKGGVVFGPKPKEVYKELSKRMKILALKSALNAKLKDNELMILDSLSLNSCKTKEFFKILTNLKVEEKRNTFVVDSLEENLVLSSRNIEDIKLVKANDLNTYDALDCKNLIFTKNAILEVQNRILKWL